MDFKLDFGNALKKTVGVCTRFGSFWREMERPASSGPAISFTTVMAIIVLASIIVANLIIFPISSGGFFFQFIIMQIIYGVILGAFLIFMPLLLAVVVKALIPALEIKVEGLDSPTLSLIFAYATAPLALGLAITELLMYIPGISVLNWLILPLAGLLSLLSIYMAFANGMSMESGHAIILTAIAGVVYVIILIILMIPIRQAIWRSAIGNMFGGYGRF